VTLILKVLKYILLSIVTIGIALFGMLMIITSGELSSHDNQRAVMEERARKLFHDLGIDASSKFVSTLTPVAYLDHPDILLKFEIHLSSLYPAVEAALAKDPCILKIGCFTKNSTNYTFSTEAFYSTNGFNTQNEFTGNTTITIDGEKQLLIFSTESD
jgi:hypothetical protein